MSRIFVAHDKGANPDEFMPELQAMFASIAQTSGKPAPELVTGHQDFNLRANLENWEPWMKSVYMGTTADGDPLFDALIRVGGLRCGSATAAITRGFLVLGKPAAALVGSRLHQIEEVIERDKGNFAAGWELRISPEPMQ